MLLTTVRYNTQIGWTIDNSNLGKTPKLGKDTGIQDLTHDVSETCLSKEAGGCIVIT